MGLSSETIIMLVDCGLDRSRVAEVIRSIDGDTGSRTSDEERARALKSLRNRRYHATRRLKDGSQCKTQAPPELKETKQSVRRQPSKTPTDNPPAPSASPPSPPPQTPPPISPTPPSPTLPSASLRSAARASRGRSVGPDLFGGLPAQSKPGAEPAQVDWREQRRRETWGLGTEILRQAGKTDKQSRTLIGKWIKGLNPEALLSILHDARKNGVLDPIPYITKAVMMARQKCGTADLEEADAFHSGRKNWKVIEQRDHMFIP